MEPLLKVQQLRVTVGDRVLQESVSFIASRGSVVRIAGHNGTGKTTLIRQILGFLPRTPNSVRFTVPLEIARDIGYFPQSWADTLLSWLDPWSNVVLGLAKRENKAISDDLLRLADTFLAASITGVSPNADPIAHHVPRSLSLRRMESLSGGEQQKIALLRTLIPQPRLVFLDEPFRDLDYTSTCALTKYLKEHVLSKSRGAIVYVSHQDTDLCPTHTVEMDL